MLRGHRVNPWELRAWERLGRAATTSRCWCARSTARPGDRAAPRAGHHGRGPAPRGCPGRSGGLATRARRASATSGSSGAARRRHRPRRGARLLVHLAGGALQARARLPARADVLGDDAVRRRLPQRAHAPLPARRPRGDRPVPRHHRARARRAAARGRRRRAHPVARRASTSSASPPRASPAAADGARSCCRVGRLVWEKGHQDVLRALALLRARGAGDDLRVLIVGTARRSGGCARTRATWASRTASSCAARVPYDELPGVYARAVLPGPRQPRRRGSGRSSSAWCWPRRWPPHLPLVASTSGAIPEVVGRRPRLFAPGDWVGLAGRAGRGSQRAGAASRPTRERAASGSRRPPPPQRLRAAYERLCVP